MATIVAKRIGGGKTPNGVRVERLAEYISAPESESRSGGTLEKCVEARAYNFLDEGSASDVAGVIEEMRAVCLEVDPDDRSELVEHWVISFNGDEPPQNEIVFSAALDFARELGFGADNQMFVGIHADTDNLHAHLMINRARVVTGKIQPRLFRDYHAAQKFLARAWQGMALGLRKAPGTGPPERWKWSACASLIPAGLRKLKFRQWNM